MASEKNAAQDIKMNEVYEQVEQPIREGETVKGVVVKVDDDKVLIDLNQFTEGTIYLEHFTNDEDVNNLKELVKIGDEIEAVVTKIDRLDGTIYLSRIPLTKDKNLSQVQSIYENKQVITVKVSKVIDKGLICVYKGIQMFLPTKLYGQELPENKKEIENQSLEVEIVKFVNGKRPTIIISRIPILREKRQQEYLRRQQLKEEKLNQIEQGDVLEVEVVKILTNSAEVAIDEYLHGQVRISQVAHQHIQNIQDHIKLGDKFKAVVLEKKGRRIDLSRKFLLPTPFDVFAEEHKVGDVIEAQVEKKVEKGLILKLAENVSCFMSVYELSWNPKNNFGAFYKIGEPLKVKIVKIDKEIHKILVSRKQLEENPWASVNVKVGDVVEVEVVKAQENNSGLDVDYNTILGFIPKTELDKNLGEYTKGEKLQAKVLKAIPQKWDLVLSVKKTKEEAKPKKELKTNTPKEKEQTDTVFETQPEEKSTIGDIFSKENLK